MKKLYNKNIISHIQKCLDTANVDITSSTSYDNILPMNMISLGSVRITFSKYSNKDGYDAIAYLNEDATKEYYKEWKKYPIGSHMMKDFKLMRTDKDGNVPYKTLEYTDIDGVKKRALIRHLFEIDDMDADQPECQEYYENYTDLIHCNQCFMVVKIVPADDKSYLRSEKVQINSNGSLTFEEFSGMIPVADDIENKSTPLFD